MALTLTTAAAADPVSLADFKLHGKVDGNGENTSLALYLKAAVDQIQSLRNLQMVDATYTLTLDRFPCDGEIVLPKAPLSSVTSVKYYDGSDTLQTLSDSSYVVDRSTEPGLVVLAQNAFWPVTRIRPDAVQVEFIAGYGDEATDVPGGLRLAALFLATHYFENRTPVVVGTIVTPMPWTFQSLISQYGYRGLA